MPVNREQLNFILALSAIAISAASFYATYLQANSAEQQVKAMTYPLIEFTHGNFNTESREREIFFTLKNAGVGPAIVQKVTFQHGEKVLQGLDPWFRDCCLEEYKTYGEAVKSAEYVATDWTLTTAQFQDIILPVGGEVEFLSLRYDDRNQAFWQALNKQRWELGLEICYCSLLEECYVTNGGGSVDEVKRCE